MPHVQQGDVDSIWSSTDMYFTDRGIEELDERRGDEQVTLGWMAERMRDFVDLNPEFETAIERLATWLARSDDGDDEDDGDRDDGDRDGGDGDGGDD